MIIGSAVSFSTELPVSVVIYRLKAGTQTVRHLELIPGPSPCTQHLAARLVAAEGILVATK